MYKTLTKMAIVGSGAVMFAGVALASGTSFSSTCGGGSCGLGGFVGNSDTGYNSYNVASLKESNSVDVRNSNYYNVNNDIDAALKTGDNVLTANNYHNGHWYWDNDRHCWMFDNRSEGGVGSIDTGDARADINVVNKGNDNYTEVRSAGPSGATVVNDTTGAHSENRASAEINNHTDVVNNNTAHVNNDINVTASTGNNRASFNTGSASITTGNADVSISVTNDLNSNSTIIK